VKPKKIIRTIVLALVFVILVHAAAPLVRAAEMRSCEAALNRCMIVAAFLPGTFYALYCIDGYIFCKKYLE